MAQSLPLVLVPGLTCTARLYRAQIEALWQFGPVTVADHRRDDDVSAIATRILAEAPKRFALCGLSMGGYIAFAMMRQAPERIAKLALMDTSARPDTPEQTTAREAQIATTQAGRYAEIPEQAMSRYLNAKNQRDERFTSIVRQMAMETGPDAYLRQLKAIMGRPDSRPLLASIKCPTMVLVGDSDVSTPPEVNKEIAAGIAGATLTIVPDCAHLSTIEQPEAVNAALAKWLAH